MEHHASATHALVARLQGGRVAWCLCAAHLLHVNRTAVQGLLHRPRAKASERGGGVLLLPTPLETPDAFSQELFHSSTAVMSDAH